MAKTKSKRSATTPPKPPPATKPAKAPAGGKHTKTAQGDKRAKPPRILKVPKGTAAGGTPAASADIGANKKLSALDAAALVLAESAEPMNCGDLIEVMAAKGYWSSPGGKTPASTLYAAILKEIVTKDQASRFRKTARGKFARS